MEHLTLAISDAALTAACDGVDGKVELRPHWKLQDARLGALAAAVNAERIAGFPSGRLRLFKRKCFWPTGTDQVAGDNEFSSLSDVVPDYPTLSGTSAIGVQMFGSHYCNFAYSALACVRTGMSGSASFHSVRKSR